MNEFVTQHAPDIALPPRGQWTTPEPQAGITPPENLYGPDGRTPLNYIQDQGGPRQFYTPEGTTPTVAPGMAPVAARTSAAPTPIQGIRGMQEPQTSRFSISAAPAQAGVTEPQNLMRRPPGPQPVQQQNYNGQAPANPAPSGTRPGSTTVPLAQATTRGERQGTMRREEPQGTSFPGILEEMGLNLPGSLGSTPAPRESNNEAIRNYSRSQGSGAVTLEDVLRSLNFDFSGLPGPRRRFDSPNQTPTNRGPSASVRIPDDVYLPTADPRADFGATGRVSRTSNNRMYDFSTPEGLAEFNRRTGFNLTPQLRTRAEQDALIRRGATRARNSAHLTGQGVDITPRQIGGLTGDAAVAEVRARLQNAGYDVDNIELIWEDGVHAGTGPHVHGQPRRQ